MYLLFFFLQVLLTTANSELEKHTTLLEIDAVKFITNEKIEQEPETIVSVSNVGDINGDQIEDFVISSSSISSDSRSYNGISFLIWGRKSYPKTINLSYLSNEGVRIIGESNSTSGWRVCSSDWNNDGRQDLMISATYDTDRDAAGKVYVIYGREHFPSEIDLASIGYYGFVITDSYERHFYDRLGFSLSSGDINNDGIRLVGFLNKLTFI